MAFLKMTSGEFMIIGPIPKDVEYKKVGDKNSSLSKFSVKASEEVNGKKETKWTNCVAWHAVARASQEYKKGDVVLVVGKMQDASYTDASGVKKQRKN